jgi:hypothetical protein
MGINLKGITIVKPSDRSLRTQKPSTTSRPTLEKTDDAGIKLARIGGTAHKPDARKMEAGTWTQPSGKPTVYPLRTTRR